MILQKIIANKREELARQKEILPLAELRQMLADSPPARDFEGALRSPGCAVIAEVKRSSPSKGRIREDFDPIGIAGIYEDHGASAISILTERKFFEGSAAYVPQIRKTVHLPLLRKDFIIDPYQITETRVLGADALLLIARLLEAGELRDFIGLSSELGLAALVEVHDEADVEKAVSSGVRIVGINNRDLATFRTDLGVSIRLANRIPKGITAVSESGINSRGDVERLMNAGIHAILVGESLMREKDIGKKLRELLGKEEDKG
ncbi:MAG TPA: indole-3-glycerol phosphate synthase TrpC [Syntrophales bacterium]|nr:indole-3-glycerol phosphate synthase TrpC [Syntrophales bacterium]